MSVFVLVHGAWHGGWCWRAVKELLEAKGHQVYTPTLTGLGRRADLMSRGITMDRMVGDVADMLRHGDLSDVVLVGHSFGGPVITGAADRESSRIRNLIYLDAAILEDGESMFDMIPQDIVTERRKLAIETSGGVSLPVPDTSIFGIMDEGQSEFVKRRLTPHPISTYETPLNLCGKPGDVAPCSYIVCTNPMYKPLAQARERAKSYDWPLYELATGHDAMISAPQDTAGLLMRISEKAFITI